MEVIRVMKNKIKLPFFAVLLIIIVIVSIVFNNLTYITREDQYSVVKQFGKIESINNSSGLRFKKPFIEDVSYISKATRLYDMNASEVITSDKKTMIIDAFILWNVTDAKVYTSALNASDNTAQGRLDVIVFNAIKTTVSSMTQDEVIASRSSKEKIEVLDVELDDVDINDLADEEDDKKVDVISMSDKLMECIGNQCEQYGIEIKDIEIKILDLPEENKAAVYDRMITERTNIATAYTAQGQSAAQMIKNTTDKEVAVMISEAEAKAEKTIAEGEAEYMKILADAYNDSDKADFYLYALQLDSLKESISSNKDNVLIIDANSPFASVFNGVN